jgi:PAS domain-containing protein
MQAARDTSAVTGDPLNEFQEVPENEGQLRAYLLDQLYVPQAAAPSSSVFGSGSGSGSGSALGLSSASATPSPNYLFDSAAQDRRSADVDVEDELFIDLVMDHFDGASRDHDVVVAPSPMPYAYPQAPPQPQPQPQPHPQPQPQVQQQAFPYQHAEPALAATPSPSMEFMGTPHGCEAALSCAAACGSSSADAMDGAHAACASSSASPALQLVAPDAVEIATTINESQCPRGIIDTNHLLCRLKCLSTMTTSAIRVSTTSCPRHQLEQLREELNRTLFYECPVPTVIFQYDRLLQVVDMNREFEGFTGVPRQQVENQQVFMNHLVVDERYEGKWGTEQCPVRKKTIQLQIRSRTGQGVSALCRNAVICDDLGRGVYVMMSVMPISGW